ncbi:MAG TPA: DUF4331 domain-containing protein, partial [Frankiaceae bacterium]|nr:DUF4331 domain-containing protein [Frankiaceae bacterium]
AALAAAAGIAVASSLYGLAPGGATASSHREAPLISADPTVDNTDLYAFVSPEREDYVTFVANWSPFSEPNGGPTFYPFATDARSNVHVDNNGDARPDATFRWTFRTIDKRGNKTFLYNNGPVTSLDDENLLFRQTYTLESSFNGGPFITRIRNAPVAPSRVGPASMPDYQTLRDQAVIDFPGGWKGFAGQAEDPFFLDLRVFDLLYGTDLSETGQDTLSGYNVNSVALQVPKSAVTRAGDPVIGIWSTTSRPSVRTTKSDGTQSYQGKFVQVSRLGNPLVNEVVIPAGLKDAFNALPPHKDATVQPAVDRVNDPEVPKLIEKIYGIKAPAAPRDDLVAVFLTGVEGLNKPKGKGVPSEVLRLNTSIAPAADPNRLGVLAKDNAGFPNGRRLGDDVVDIGLQALEGAVRTGKIVEPLAKGDGVDANEVAFLDAFPYVALPNDAAVNTRTQVQGTKQTRAGNAPAGSTGGNAPAGGVAAGAGGTANAAGRTEGRDTAPLAAGLLVVAAAGFGSFGFRRMRAAKVNG